MKQTFFVLLFAAFFGGNLLAQEVGVASYYADKFHDRPTASGELYKIDQMTAAHKTLPFNTVVKVTRMDDGRSVIVRINDRGPHVAGRIIDLSGAAAEFIGLKQDGTTKVVLHELKVDQPLPPPAMAAKGPSVTTAPVSTPVMATPPAPVETTTIISSVPETQISETHYTHRTSVVTDDAITAYSGPMIYGVQVAAVHNTTSAFQIAEKYKKMWFKPTIFEQRDANGVIIYKIVLGSYPTKAQADVYKTNLKKNKKVDGFVVSVQ